jgi:hypothetical protein
MQMGVEDRHLLVGARRDRHEQQGHQQGIDLHFLLQP